MLVFLLVCLGGAVGTGARYLVTVWALEALGPAFPWATFLVNAVGSFLLAALMYAGLETSTVPPTLRLAVGTGVLGGFTTYSTFSFETMRYLQTGSWALALLNVAATVLVCLLACVAGWVLARAVLGAP